MMSSSRRRLNHRLVLERAYLSNRAGRNENSRTSSDTSTTTSTSNQTFTQDGARHHSNQDSDIIQVATVTSSCTPSINSISTDSTSSSLRRLPIVSTSGHSMNMSHHPAFTWSDGHSQVRVTLSMSNRSSPQSLPRGSTSSNQQSTRSSSTRDDSSGDEADDHGEPLFLGYPSSQLMASSLGIIEGHGHLDSTMPVRGEPFCQCYETGGDTENCTCGEEDTVFDWSWEEKNLSSAVHLSDHGRTVKFHPDFSSGTAAVRGNKVMKDGQHYWEVKMTTHVYGTDMMIGVGTANVDLNRYHHTFCSFLGEDTDSWGISYTGHIHHSGESRLYTKKFGQGTVIGVHLDLWRGTMEYYMNRKPLGIAFTGLAGKTVYPMACSTAARSGMKIIRSCSFQSTLQLLCCQTLRRFLPPNLSVIDAINLPPGLRAFLQNNMAWLLWPKTSAVPSRKYEDLSDDEKEHQMHKKLKADIATSDSETESVLSD